MDVDAVPEGTVVFPHEPLVRVTGSLLEAQLLETALLNLVNFPTLVATKAAHVTLAAGGAPVLEFGLRRAQGPDGGLTASRSAYLGGCFATSNVLAGRLFDIPVRGTHAHSWVLSFASEQEAFDAWADVMPGNAVMLVDTYDSVEGIANAIDTGKRMRERGHRLAGIRLDSGDLAYLSNRAREMLDAEGSRTTQVIASNDLDPETIESLQAQGARIDVWGVGTKLVTCYDQPALGGVYKLTAITGRRRVADAGQGQLGHGEDHRAGPARRAPLLRRRRDRPGGHDLGRAQRARRLAGDRRPRGLAPPDDDRRRLDATRRSWSRCSAAASACTRCRRSAEARDHARHELGTLHPAILRQLRPHWYPAGLEWSLHRRRESLIEAALEAEATRRRLNAPWGLDDGCRRSDAPAPLTRGVGDAAQVHPSRRDLPRLADRRGARDGAGHVARAAADGRAAPRVGRDAGDRRLHRAARRSCSAG